jgi:hypothetical protein
VLSVTEVWVLILGHRQLGSNEIVRNFIRGSSDEFTVESNHGGFFVRFGKLQSLLMVIYFYYTI